MTTKEVSLAELITAQIKAQRAGQHVEFHRLQLVINNVERWSFRQPFHAPTKRA